MKNTGRDDEEARRADTTIPHDEAYRSRRVHVFAREKNIDSRNILILSHVVRQGKEKFNIFQRHI